MDRGLTPGVEPRAGIEPGDLPALVGRALHPLSYRDGSRGTGKATGEERQPGGSVCSCMARLYCLCPDGDTLPHKSANIQ